MTTSAKAAASAVKTLAFSAAFGALAMASAVSAQAADGVKIGILNDQSGVYADFGGKWSVEAAKMAVEDFGGKVLGQPIEIVNADHQNKPDIASNIARQWYDVDKVDMIMELTTSSVALAVQGLSKEKKKIDIVTGAATTRPDRQACRPTASTGPIDTHALAVGTGGALVKAGGDSWFFLTADYAFGYSLEEETVQVREAEGRQGPRLGAPPAHHHRLLVLPAAGARLRAQGDRPRQCRPRHRELDQAGGRVRHRRRAASGSRRCCSRSPKCTASASRRRRAWC